MSRIRQEITFAAPPARVFRALTDAAEFARVTGAPAEIAAVDGGAFSCFGGHVVGRQIELQPGARIVQAWRPITWPAGVYSIARFELSADGAGTRLAFEQEGVPEKAAEHIDAGWKTMYWEPLAKFLAG
jgi:activator of HSP90 ATPase